MIRLIARIKVDFNNGELRKYSINKLCALWNNQTQTPLKIGLAYEGRDAYFQLIEVEKPMKKRIILKR